MACGVRCAACGVWRAVGGGRWAVSARFSFTPYTPYTPNTPNTLYTPYAHQDTIEEGNEEEGEGEGEGEGEDETDQSSKSLLSAADEGSDAEVDMDGIADVIRITETGMNLDDDRLVVWGGGGYCCDFLLLPAYDFMSLLVTPARV